MAEEEERPSALARAGLLVLLAAILVVAVYGLTHVSLSRVNPAQKRPDKHFGNVPCVACHTVSENAKLVQE